MTRPASKRPLSIPVLAGVSALSLLGIGLFASGETFSLWNNNVTPSTAAVINTGTLAVTSGTPQSWVDVTDPANPTTIASLADTPIDPGSSYRLTQQFTVNMSGNNLKAQITATLPSSTTDKTLLAQTDLKLTIVNSSGTTIATDARVKATSASFTTPAATPITASGTYTVIVDVTYRDDANNVGQNQTLQFGNLSFSANQLS